MLDFAKEQVGGCIELVAEFFIKREGNCSGV
jgi:hypothetical protein